MSITTHLHAIRQAIPTHVDLVCVSKFHPIEAILEAYQAGERIFGESRVQELLQKIPVLPEDIKWHFIGHLQTNKVKQLVGKVDLIHGVDSIRLLEEIDTQSRKIGVVSRILLEVHVAQEESKQGFLPEEVMQLLKKDIHNSYPNITLCGIMGMATFTDDQQIIAREFTQLQELFDSITSSHTELSSFNTLSMGMSGDYALAIDHGSTMVRIGSSIFGERNY